MVEVAFTGRWPDGPDAGVGMICTQGVLRSVDHAALPWLTGHGVALGYVGDGDCR